MLLKNTKLFALLLVVAVALFSGCGKTTDTELLNPTLLFSSDTDYIRDDSVAVGTTARFKGTFTKGSEGKNLASARIERNIDGQGVIVIWSVSGKNETSISFDTTIALQTTALANIKNEFSFIAVDKDNNTLTQKINLIVKKPTTTGPTPANSKPNVTFSNATAYFASTGSGSSPVDKTTATASPSAIDLVYYFRAADSTHSFIQPSALKADPYLGTPAEWSAGLVPTEFKTTTKTEADFMAAKADVTLIAPAYEGGTLSTYVGNTPGVRIKAAANTTIVNQVFAFNGKDGKKGLVLVKSSLNSGSITVDIITEN